MHQTGKTTSSISDEERFRWHAYDYGWRRVYLNDFRHESTIDRDGTWFDRQLADAAERMWRAYRAKSLAPDKPLAPRSPHPFPSAADYDWQAAYRDHDHTEEDWRRIEAYRAAGKALGRLPTLGDLLAEARRQYRPVFRQIALKARFPHRVTFSAPTSQDAVRTTWRDIPGPLLTDAERRLAEPAITALAEEARRNVVTVERKRAAFFDPRPPAREIFPDRPKPAHVATPPEEVLASLERLGGD